MEVHELKYSGTISIFYFYDTIISEINSLKAQGFWGQIILDFSDVEKLESPVIPNLLILGNYINDCIGNKPLIYIDETRTSGALKRYLYKIAFFNLCEQNERFYLDCDKYTGWPETSEMDKANTTVYFQPGSLDELDEWQKKMEYPKLSARIWDDIYNNLYNFASNYLGCYQKYTKYNDVRSEMESNMALSMIHEVVKNSLSHGKSYSYVTFQIDRSYKKIYLTFSDYGVGFLKTIAEKEKNVKNEGMAIIKGIFARAEESGYGLFEVVSKSLQCFGVVRIHSNDTKIVLTNSEEDVEEIGDDGCYPYLTYVKRHDFNGLLKKLYKHKNYNYIEKCFFPGVHVEIVLPIEIKTRNKRCL